MSNHPNCRRQESAAANPAPTQIRLARESAGLTQTAAAAFIYSTLRAWQDWEAGARRMHPGLWELWQIKTRHLQREARVHASLAAMIARAGGGFAEILNVSEPMEIPDHPGVFLMSSKSMPEAPWHAEMVDQADESLRATACRRLTWHARAFPGHLYRIDFVEVRDPVERLALLNGLRSTGAVDTSPSMELDAPTA